MRYLVIATVLAPAIASAHIALVDPPPRTNMLKTRQCGDPTAPRGTPMVLPPGSTYTVKWLETVDHPGHYRISFDNDGDDFFIPPNTTATTVGMDPTVMIDLIPDVQGNFPPAGRPYSQQITFPNIECTNCTLQVIQLMTDKPPYTTAPTSDDIYFQCADIQLKTGSSPPPDAGVTPGDDAGTTTNPSEGGCHVGGGGGGAGVFALTLAFVIRRRRRC
jgi:MYXO-CTERM domain-containing protein